MFTQNYISYRRALFCGLTASDENIATGLIGPTVTPVITTSGVSEKYACVSATNVYGSLVHTDIGRWMGTGRCQEIPTSTYLGSADTTNAGIYFGTGSTPATLNDYTLQNPITSGLTITNPTKIGTGSDGKGQFYFSSTFIITNDTSAEINIWEIGLISSVFTNSSFQQALMERTVLTEPITIPAGESKLVTYKITFNQTLNVE